MSVSGIQGFPLEVTVVGCYKLDDKQWMSKQDPYVYVEYGSTRLRTRTCTDGGKHPTFQEKFMFTLIEGLQELTVVVWNSNTLKSDDHIGTGRVLLQKALSQGYDDASWSLHSKNGRFAGEIRLILHYANANQPKAKSVSSETERKPPKPPLYPPLEHYSVPPYYAGYPPNPTHYPPPAGYPPQPCPTCATAYPPHHHHPHPSAYYPAGTSGSYPPPPFNGVYPPSPQRSGGLYPPPTYY